MHHHVPPVVSEVVEVQGWRSAEREIFRELRLPTGSAQLVMRDFVVRNADAFHTPTRSVDYRELMKMIVQPTHGVLNRNMQIPEGIVLRHLNAPPNHRIGLTQHHEELMNLRGTLPPAPSSTWSSFLSNHLPQPDSSDRLSQGTHSGTLLRNIE
jgi:hypothetical protein